MAKEAAKEALEKCVQEGGKFLLKNSVIKFSSICSKNPVCLTEGLFI